MATDDEDGSLVLVVGYEGSDPARRALAAAGRILQGRKGWIEVVQITPDEGGGDGSSEPPADVIDSLGPAQVDLHYEVRSVLQGEQSWRVRSTSGAVAEELTEAAQAIAQEGGPTRTVVIVVGSDRKMAFSVPITLARQSSFPVIIVP